MFCFYSGPPLLTIHHCSLLLINWWPNRFSAMPANENKYAPGRCCFADLFALLSHRPLFSAAQKFLPQGPINRCPEDDQVSRLWVSNWGCGHAQGSPQGPETPEGLSGLIAYSIWFCLFVTIKDHFIFAKSKFALVIIDGVLGPLCLGRHKWHCPCISGWK